MKCPIAHHVVGGKSFCASLRQMYARELDPYQENRDANHLMLLSGRVVLLRSATGQGADSLAELLLQVGQGSVVAGGSAGAGAVAKPGEGRFVFAGGQPARPAGTLLLTRHVPEPSRPIQRARLDRQIVVAQSAPPARAGPRVVLGPADHARPHGVPLDVADRRPVMLGIQRAREKPALPEHALHAHLAVVLLGVTQVDRLEHRCQGGGVGRNGHEMDMVGHQAVRADYQASVGGVLAEKLEIEAPLGVAMEHIQPPIAPLGNMMSPARNHDSSSAWHKDFLTRMARNVKARSFSKWFKNGSR